MVGLLDPFRGNEHPVHVAHVHHGLVPQDALDFPAVLAVVHFADQDPAHGVRQPADEVFRAGPEGFEHRQRHAVVRGPQFGRGFPGGPGRDPVGEQQGVGVRLEVGAVVGVGVHGGGKLAVEVLDLGGDLRGHGGDIAVFPVGAGGLAAEPLAADGQKIGDLPPLGGGEGEAGAPLGTRQPVHRRRPLAGIQVHGLPGEADLLVGGQEHGAAVGFGQVEGPYGQGVTVGGVHRGEHDGRAAAGVGPAQKLHVAIGALGGAAGGGAQALDVHDHQGDLRTDGETDVLAVEADPRAAGGRHGLDPGHGGPDAVAHGGDLVLALDDDSPRRRQESQHGVENAGGRRDGVAGEKPAPGIQGPPADGLVSFQQTHAHGVSFSCEML